MEGGGGERDAPPPRRLSTDKRITNTEKKSATQHSFNVLYMLINLTQKNPKKPEGDPAPLMPGPKHAADQGPGPSLLCLQQMKAGRKQVKAFFESSPAIKPWRTKRQRGKLSPLEEDTPGAGGCLLHAAARSAAPLPRCPAPSPGFPACGWQTAGQGDARAGGSRLL